MPRVLKIANILELIIDRFNDVALAQQTFIKPINTCGFMFFFKMTIKSTF